MSNRFNFTSRSQKYTQIEKESLAIIFGIKLEISTINIFMVDCHWCTLPRKYQFLGHVQSNYKCVKLWLLLIPSSVSMQRIVSLTLSHHGWTGTTPKSLTPFDRRKEELGLQGQEYFGQLKQLGSPNLYCTGITPQLFNPFAPTLLRRNNGMEKRH